MNSLAQLLLALTIMTIFSRKTTIYALNLFVSKDEMFRTLGVWAEMVYVSNGQVNNYSTQFPYRIAENVSQLHFIWSNPKKNLVMRYSIAAVPEQFDVLPILHFPAEGIVPRRREKFAVEYRCVGHRSGQFQISLHFNLTSPGQLEPLRFTLKQEKMCTSIDGRRTFAGSENLSSHLFNSTQLFYLSLVGVILLVLVCAVSVCICMRAKHQQHQKPNPYGISALTTSIRPNPIHRFSTTLRNSIRRLHSTTTTINYRKPPGTSSADAKDNGTMVESGVAVVLDGGSTSAASQPFLLQHQQPSTTTAPFPTTKYLVPSKSLLSLRSNSSITKDPHLPRVIFERRENMPEISHVLVELNADRNLFEVMPYAELEGTFSEIVWASWRQIGDSGTGLSGDIDDEEDDACQDTALICKTLKHGADRIHFEKFLIDALRFHNVPAHPNLAHVTAAATFGNFLNPDSVKDLPLICYKHAGFGILKKFLLNCRGSEPVELGIPQEIGQNNVEKEPKMTGLPSTLKIHDLVSMASQLIRAVQHLHKFGVIHKDIATRNCLVSRWPRRPDDHPNRLHLQLCDCALSPDLFPADYHLATDALANADAKPVKWMPPETLASGVFNSAADVWAFGVFIWELLSGGQQPFEELAPEDLPRALANGQRLSQPYNCPNELYELMLLCWDPDPLRRPTPSELAKSLYDFNGHLRKYI